MLQFLFQNFDLCCLATACVEFQNSYHCCLVTAFAEFVDGLVWAISLSARRASAHRDSSG